MPSPGEAPYVWVPMSDGVCLSVRLFLPEGDDGPWPVLLEALPYRKDDLTASYSSDYRRLRDEGRFAVARVDLRGTGASEGFAEDEYPAQEQADLIEVIAWLAAAPWSNGAVGMFGTSYSGFNSLQLAAERAPGLGAVCAIYASDDRYTDDVHYMGGALKAVDLVDYVLYMTAMVALPPPPALAGEQWRDRWAERIDRTEPWLLRWLEEQWDGPYWRHGSLRQRGSSGEWVGYDRIEIPTMIVAGWADGYRNNSFRTFERLPERGRELLVGPWAHMSTASSLPGPHIDLIPEMIRFFDTWLRDSPPATPTAPVRVFLRRPTVPAPDLAQHRGEWRADATWPPPDAHDVVFNGPQGRHDVLSVRGDVGTTAWISCAGALPWGQPTDQRPDEGMSLVYDWPAREADLVIAGHPELTVTLQSDAPVAFLAAKLCNVFPDGTSQLVTRGFLNLCHRDGSLAPEPLTPDEPTTITFQLEATAWIFEPGHQVRLDLAGADWPNSWPPPTPVTLTVDTGSIRLVLPTLHGAADRDDGEPAPVFTPAPVEPDESDPGGPPTVWKIEHDVLGRRTRAIVDHGSRFPGEHGARMEEHYTGEVAVSTVDPGDASAHATARYVIEWPEVTVSSEARLEVRSDRDAFEVTVELDAHEGDEVFRSRRWYRHIPRRLQ